MTLHDAVTRAVTYGPFGTVLVIQSWLVGVGVVVFGEALAGRLLYEELPRVGRALKGGPCGLLRTVPAVDAILRCRRRGRDCRKDPRARRHRGGRPATPSVRDVRRLPPIPTGKSSTGPANAPAAAMSPTNTTTL